MNPSHSNSASRAQRGITSSERMAGLAADTLRRLREIDGLIKTNRIDLAEQRLASLATGGSLHAEVLRVQGLLHHLHGRHAQAIVTLSKALKKQPNDAMILNHLGALLREAGQADEGMRMLRRACALSPDLATAWINFGTALEAEGQTSEGAAALERALELQPDHAQLRVTYGNMLRSTGKIDAAIAQYRETIRRQPQCALAWFSLLDLKTVSVNADERAVLQRLSGNMALSERDRAFAGFALGLALENAQLYEDAFRAFGAANGIWRKTFRWDLHAYSALMDQFMAAFSDPVASSLDPDLGREVIFVTSLPRSGSTLSEQILSAHPQVDGAGELPDMPATLQEESNRRRESFPQWVGKASAEDWRRLGRRYLDRTRKKHGEQPLFTDKSLAN